MNLPEIPDPLFRQAVAALDAGDVRALADLLAAHPALVRDRLDYGEEGYFRRPYLLWFVAENPIRNERLPKNIVEVARTIVEAVRRSAPDSLPEQLDYTLALVASGRVPREEGVQIDLLDALVAAGARPEPGVKAALAHREVAAAEWLLAHGAPLTLLAAVCIGRIEDAARLLPATAGERQTALTAAAFYGRADLLRLLIPTGVDVSGFGTPGFHAHATALHEAVDSKSLAAVEALVEAGADVGVRDRIHQATPLG